MPGIGDQQVLQQLLTGMNTMQMQTGLMPGGVPALNNQNTYRPQPTATPAQFSNDLAINLRNTFSYQAMPPPMFGGITPVPRTQEAQGYLPGATMGGGWGMARQQAQGNAAKFLTSAQTTTGFGARAAFGTGVGMLATPFVGPWGGAAIGYGADYLLGDTVERMAQMPFKPLIDQQQRAMQLQNMSMNNVRRGPDLSASGMGLSLTASMDLERNLMRTADNRNFKRDTGGMFNRQDMMRLTEISSQVGLLDNSQSVDQISRDMGKIGRALSTFMKVVEEPDVRKALSMMGNMRQLGMSIPETNVAAANARTYARMAGTTVQGVMQAGMQGAGMFQQYGMSAATGLNVGMAATGTAGMLGTVLDPRTLSMLGGREGIASSLTSSTAQMSQIGAILPGLLSRGKGGKLGVDEAALNNLMTGRGSIEDLVRQSSARMSGKQGADFITEYSTRKSELQDQVMNSMGGMGGILLPLMLARRTVESGVTKDMGAALRIAGLDEKQARTYQLLAESGTLGDTLRQQQRTMQIERQKVRAQRREGLTEAASEGRWSQFGADTLDATYNVGFAASRGIAYLGGRALGADLDTSARSVRRGLRGIGNAAERFQRDNFGVDTDIEEQQIAAGGGRLLRAIRPGELSDASMRERLSKKLTTDTGADAFLQNWSKGVRAASDPITGDINRYIRQRDQMGSQDATVALPALAARLTMGPGGALGMTTLGRGGENAVETIYGNAGLQTRMMTGAFAEFAGVSLRESAATIRQRAASQAGLGRDIELALAGKVGSAGTLREMADARKISPTDMAQATAKAAGAVKQYFRNQQTRVGPFAFQTGDPSDVAVDKTIETAIKSIPNLSDADRKQLARDMRSEVIRSASEGMSGTEKAFLTKLAAGGADVNSQIGSGATQQGLLDEAEGIRKKALGRLGIQTYWGDDIKTARAAVSVFSQEGVEGELQQKFLVAKALDAAAAASGDTKLAERANLIRSTIESETGKGGKYSSEQTAGARAAAGEAASQMDKDQLEGMGKAFGRQKDANLDKNLAAARKAFQSEAAEKDFGAAAIGLLGTEEARIFQAGAGSGKGVEKLREYYSGKGDKAKLKSLEGMTDAQLARKISKRVGLNAEGVFAGGLSQRAEDAVSEQDARAGKAIDKIEEDMRKDREASAGEFGEVVSNFAKATNDYAAGARDILHAFEKGDITTVMSHGHKTPSRFP